MIHLDFTGIASGIVPLGHMHDGNLSRFCRKLRNFSHSSHLRTYGNHVEVTQLFGSRNCVPDVDRYRVCVLNRRWHVRGHSNCRVAPNDNSFRDLSTTSREFESTILLLLESPHKGEYRCGNPSIPIAPAQGRTGARIDKFLECVLNAPYNAPALQGVNATSRVIIANPVQFQTSLWVIHRGHMRNWRTLRNAVWKTLWDMPRIRCDFRRRLRRYHPDVVLNCCTYGLQKPVSKFVAGCGLTTPIYESHHPSRWHCAVRLRSP